MNFSKMLISLVLCFVSITIPAQNPDSYYLNYKLEKNSQGRFQFEEIIEVPNRNKTEVIQLLKDIINELGISDRFLKVVDDSKIFTDRITLKDEKLSIKLYAKENKARIQVTDFASVAIIMDKEVSQDFETTYEYLYKRGGKVRKKNLGWVRKHIDTAEAMISLFTIELLKEQKKKTEDDW